MKAQIRQNFRPELMWEFVDRFLYSALNQRCVNKNSPENAETSC